MHPPAAGDEPIENPYKYTSGAPLTAADRMILHLAAFIWKDDVTPDDVAELTAALRAMAARIPELRFYDCGENLRVRPSRADYGVAAIVDEPTRSPPTSTRRPTPRSTIGCSAG